jgi:hypothetical protein
MHNIFYSQKKKRSHNSYKFTFLTFEAVNKTRRYKRNRQISYGPNRLHQLDQTSKIISHLLVYFAGAGREGLLSSGARGHMPAVPNE